MPHADKYDQQRTKKYYIYIYGVSVKSSSEKERIRMNKNDEILLKLSSIENVVNEIQNQMQNLLKENADKSLEQIQIMLRIENIADFIKTRYNAVVEEKEKFITETMENNKTI